MIDSAQKAICACPLNGKICADGIREDFPDGPVPGQKVRCRWWQHVAGKDPQSTNNIDWWDCAIAWLPTTTLETAQRANQAGASVDKVANQVNELQRNIGGLGKAIQVAAQNIRQGIEAGALHVMLPPPDTPQSSNGMEGHE